MAELEFTAGSPDSRPVPFAMILSGSDRSGVFGVTHCRSRASDSIGRWPGKKRLSSTFFLPFNSVLGNAKASTLGCQVSKATWM